MKDMWEGKKKAVTFSFDDGIVHDLQALEIMNKYNLKGTFNLNAGYIGTFAGGYEHIRESKIKQTYEGHEVAAHTLTHAKLPELDEETIIRQVELDRKLLSEIVGYNVVGMAYPGGGVNNDDRVAEIIRNNTPIKYARTTSASRSFELQTNLLRFRPTCCWVEEWAEELIDKFIALETDTPQLFYIWGHSNELTEHPNGSVEKFERFCQKLAGHADIFYGTNKEVLL